MEAKESIASAPPSSKTPITKEFLEKILKRKVIKFTLSTGSKPGDNYTSTLISLEVQVADAKDHLHLLYKTFPTHPTRALLLKLGNVFLKECQVYDTWFPELIKVQQEIIHNEPLLTPPMPELVAGAFIDYEKVNPSDWDHLDPMLHNFLLMVDVRKTYDLKMASRVESLGYKHAKVVLSELAKYHALGHAYKTHRNVTSVAAKFPFIYDRFFCDPNHDPLLKDILVKHVHLIMDMCKELLTSRPEIADSLEKFKNPDLAPEYLCAYLRSTGMDEIQIENYMRIKPKQYSGAPLKDQWIVPVHGDSWTNNFLFNEDVTLAVLVDQQLARESCLTADLAYFFFTSTTTDFRKKHLYEMLAWYYEKFVHFCDLLKTPPFPGFSLENLQRKFHRSKIFGFIFSVFGLPLSLQKEETVMNLDTLSVPEEGYNDDNTLDELAGIFTARGRDEDDKKRLRDRFTALLTELYDEGVL